MQTVAVSGERASSSAVRAALAAGDLDRASALLGRAFSMSGRVAHGKKLGRNLGFPTANMDTAGLVLPPTGVYAMHVQTFLRHSTHESRGAFHGVLNIGYRPTLKSAVHQLRVEAYLLDFNADLYGQELEITFIDKIREEQKFLSLAALKEQITRDVVVAKTRF